jgi:hypothetical protein
MGDFNDKVRTGGIVKDTTFEELHMMEAITTYIEGVDLLVTFKHNQSQTIIDGIWTM